MTIGAVVLVVLTLCLAYANGSNDISKGIATLVGSGVSNLPAAVLWGTVWTVLGGLTAAFASQGLVATFSGKGFLATPVSGHAFLSAVAVGTIAWVLFASRTGLPVSTTHAIVGSLAGAGIVAQGASSLHWSVLAAKVALPLAVSPLAAVLLLYAVHPFLQKALSRADRYCVCLERRVAIAPTGAAAMTIVEGPILAPAADCDDSPAIAGRIGVSDALHWLSSGLTSFARGVNDTPKIVALGFAAAAAGNVKGLPFYAAVAVAMAAGSLVAGARVTRTLATKVTPMSPGEGLSANLVTTLLVGVASLRSLPVSTTHVSSGAIIGIGLHRGGRAVRWKTVREMLLAWLVTVPAAAFAAAALYSLIR
jgi:PiT family inorganic phosphate transporter